MPKVSIITANYNYENEIKSAIESVINQTYFDWEMLIVDDGSKDKSIEVIQEFVQKDSRIKLLTHKDNVNKGLPETIQLGLKHAKGNYIVFLEADDIIVSDYLIKKIKIFEANSDIGLVYNDIQTFGDENIILEKEKYLNTIRNFWEEDGREKFCDAMHLYCLIPTFSSVMLKKELLDDCNFEPPIKAWLDWWLWAQISSKTNIFYLSEKLTSWRLHSKSYIKRNETNVKYYKEAYIYKKKLQKLLPNIKSDKYKKIYFKKAIIRFFLYETFAYKIYYKMRGCCE